MTTVMTRIGGIPFRLTVEGSGEDSRWIGAFTGDMPAAFVPLVYIGTGDKQRRSMMQQAVDEVVRWQDLFIEDGSKHLSEHAIANINAMLRMGPESEPISRCSECLYWHAVLEQRLMLRESHSVTPLPEVTEPPGKVAAFYSSQRLTFIGIPYVEDGRLLVHVEAITPWGEAVAAEAPVEDVMLRRGH